MYTNLHSLFLYNISIYILKNQQQTGTYLSSNKGYSQSRHYNLSGSNTKGLVQGDSGHPGQDFAIHQMDHMKRALGQDGTKVFDEHAFGEKDIIPDGQRNEFEITNKGKKYISKKKIGIMESMYLRI